MPFCLPTCSDQPDRCEIRFKVSCAICRHYSYNLELLYRMSRTLILIVFFALGVNLQAQQDKDEEFAIRQVILRFDGKDQYLMLSPMRIYSPYNGLYYALKLSYTPAMMDLMIAEGDRLTFEIDYGQVELTAYDVKTTDREIVVYYHIDKWDLVDIGNSRNAIVKVHDQFSAEKINLTRNNINEYKLFASGYVLGTLFIPDHGQSVKEHWGFISVGYGTVFGIWLTKYFNLFFSGTELIAGDFLSAGVGFAPFSYYVYQVNRFPVFDENTGWYLDYAYRLPEKKSDPVYHFGIMYGLSNRSLIADVSVEIGFSLQYFMHRTGYDEMYTINQIPLTPDSPERVYRIISGSAMEGFAGGIFLQAGILWIHANTLKAWSAGLSAPIPWW